MAIAWGVNRDGRGYAVIAKVSVADLFSFFPGRHIVYN